MIRWAALATALLLQAGIARAQVDYVVSHGKLSDTAFYNLASCAAPPGQACRKPHRKWEAAKARSISVGIVQQQRGYPKAKAQQVTAGLGRAVDAINAVGSGIQLKRAPTGQVPDIEVYLVNIRAGGVMYGTGHEALDGSLVGNAMVTYWYEGTDIRKGVIAFSSTMKRREIDSIVLEELFQSLGFLTDIRNKAYRNVSIIDQNGSKVTTVAGQDAMLLHRKYP